MRKYININIQSLDPYSRYAYKDLMKWCDQLDRSPSLFNSFSSAIQNKINNFIPNKVHNIITKSMREMIKVLMLGTKFISPTPKQYNTLSQTENQVNKIIKNHKLTASAEGGLTGAGGFVWSLADFPILLGIKIKLLQSIAAHYGYDGNKIEEKIFILLILQTAFSSDKIRRQTLYQIINFEQFKSTLPENVNEMDWQTLQQQYRDYIDIAKLMQMIPFIGAVVGLIANYNLVKKLGKVAMQCYRIRHFQQLSSVSLLHGLT